MKKIFSVIFGTYALIIIYLLFFPTDQLSEWLFGKNTGENTQYSQNYSESAFHKIKKGMPESKVIQLLGPPLYEYWLYKQDNSHAFIDFQKGIVTRNSHCCHDCLFESIKKGMTTKEVQEKAGMPLRKHWKYSEQIENKLFKRRDVILKEGKVKEINGGLNLELASGDFEWWSFSYWGKIFDIATAIAGLLTTILLLKIFKMNIEKLFFILLISICTITLIGHILTVWILVVDPFRGAGYLPLPFPLDSFSWIIMITFLTGYFFHGLLLSYLLFKINRKNLHLVIFIIIILFSAYSLPWSIGVFFD